MNIFKQLIVFGLLLISINLFSQIPAGYYDSAEGLEDELLRQALHNIIDDHDPVSYDDLWDVYEDSDKRADGKVWDMYSTCNFNFGSDQCGNYQNICDCFNREHTVPQSWFNDASPMVTDAHHVVPTDGKVNGYRSNWPYGECTSGTSYGTGRLGSCTYPGYSGTVFEPDDEYKGDFARIYFYMATRYMDVMSSWPGGASFSGNNFSEWTRKMLLDWHHDDPVSPKEVARNNAVYSHQDNRNPFIDNPIWADAIWDPDYMPSFTAISESYFAVYPNPAKDFLEIKQNIILHGQSVVIMSDVSGRVIVESKLENNLQIDLSKFPEGLYIISIINNGKQVYCKKISVIR